MVQIIDDAFIYVNEMLFNVVTLDSDTYININSLIMSDNMAILEAFLKCKDTGKIIHFDVENDILLPEEYDILQIERFIDLNKAVDLVYKSTDHGIYYQYDSDVYFYNNDMNQIVSVPDITVENGEFVFIIPDGIYYYSADCHYLFQSGKVYSIEEDLYTDNTIVIKELPNTKYSDFDISLLTKKKKEISYLIETLENNLIDKTEEIANIKAEMTKIEKSLSLLKSIED